MRQWGVDPKFLCTKHLLGEHVEHHMFIGTLKKDKSIKGFLDKKLFDPTNVYKRHDELVKEMTFRNMNHKSPLEVIDKVLVKSTIDIQANIFELQRRCSECRKRILQENET